MMTLLRSTFIVAPTDVEELFLRNYTHLLDSGLGFTAPADIVIWDFTKEFIKAHNHVPGIQSLRAHFERLGEAEVVDRLEVLSNMTPLTRGNFVQRLENKAEDRRVRVMGELLRDAGTILSEGLEVKEKKTKGSRLLRGPHDAFYHLMDNSDSIITPTLGSNLSGEALSAGSIVEEQYDKVKADPLAGIGQMTGLQQMDTLAGAKKYELWIHAGFTGAMKCVAGDTRLFDLKRGLMRTAKEIFESGDTLRVGAFDEETWELRAASTSPVVESGVRPILRVTSTSGRDIRVSSNHPFLTPQGWVDAGDLQEGAWVAVPCGLPPCEAESPFTDHEVKLLGYLLGDGYINGDISFTNKNPDVIEDFTRCLGELGYLEHKGEGRSEGVSFQRRLRDDGASVVRVSRSGGKKRSWESPLRTLLEALGLWGCTSGDKHIPSSLWGIQESQVWLLLSALWSTDGTVFTGSAKGRKPRATLAYTTKSKVLAHGIQDLLQRVSVPSTLSFVTSKYKGECRIYWTVSITTNEGKRAFLGKSHIVGKLEAVASAFDATSPESDTDWVPPQLLAGVAEGVRARTRKGGWHYAKWAKGKSKIQRDTLLRLAKEAGSSDLLKKAKSSVQWDRVRSISHEDAEMTYDISVPGPATFVANGFITHNSTLMLNWLYNQAVYYHHSNLIFSLEMPYIQNLNLLYAMHSYHEKFLDVRYGLGLQSRPDSSVGLDYMKIKMGVLDDKEEQFFKQHVIADFNDPKNNYGKIHIEVADVSRQRFTMDDLKRVSARLYSKSPFAMICVDHVDNMEAVGRVSSKTEKLNEILRALKMQALYFNRGQGIAVVGLYQINREGYKTALKVKEKTGVARYNLTALSHSSEAERSADIVTAAWSDDELKARNRVQLQCLKTRDMQPFDMFLGRVEWPCRRILTCFDIIDPEASAKSRAAAIKETMGQDDEVDKALALM